MAESEWEIEEYPLAEVFLDQENIRIPNSQVDQNSLILDLFDNENALEVAKSYSENGVYPHEFPIGIKESNRVIVIEGNRRVAALKALYEPDILPSYTNKLKRLKNPGIESIEMVMAPNRNAAIKYIANQHTTTQRRPWKPLRQAYFYQSQIEGGKTIEQLIREYPDHDIPRFIKMLEIHKLAKSAPIEDTTLRTKVNDDRDFPITTLARFYDDPSAAKFLGVSFDKQGIIQGKIQKEEFQKANKKLVEDIASGKITSRNSNSSTDINKLLGVFPKENTPDSSKKGTFTTSDFSASQFGAGNHKSSLVSKPTSKGKSTTSKKSPRGLFRKAEVPFNVSSSSLKIMYDELRRIDVAAYPNATHDFMRSFLECSLCVYLKSVDEYINVKARKNNQPTLAEMLTFLGADECELINDKNVKQVVKQVKSDFGSQYSLERMNMINLVVQKSPREADISGVSNKTGIA